MPATIVKKGRTHIGRPPIFDDEAKALKIIREESERCRKMRKPCTLSSLSAEVASEFGVFLRKTSDEKKDLAPSGFKKTASQDAMKQAIYKIVVKNGIWLSTKR